MPDVRPPPGQAPVCLRPYQALAIQQIDDFVAQGTRRILVVAPTGAGKTSIAGSLILRAVRQGQQVLFLAHRREIIVQNWHPSSAMRSSGVWIEGKPWW